MPVRLEAGSGRGGQGQRLTRMLAYSPAILDLATYVSLHKLFGCGEGEAIADDDTHPALRQLRRPEAAMIRKTFILLLALLLAAVVAQAQQAEKGHRIGVLLYAGAPPGLLETFWEGLRALGYVEGHNLTIAIRNAEG